jgi:hypothetical protein
LGGEVVVGVQGQIGVGCPNTDTATCVSVVTYIFWKL